MLSALNTTKVIWQSRSTIVRRVNSICRDHILCCHWSSAEVAMEVQVSPWLSCTVVAQPSSRGICSRFSCSRSGMVKNLVDNTFFTFGGHVYSEKSGF